MITTIGILLGSRPRLPLFLLATCRGIAFIAFPCEYSFKPLPLLQQPPLAKRRLEMIERGVFLCQVSSVLASVLQLVIAADSIAEFSQNLRRSFVVLGTARLDEVLRLTKPLLRRLTICFIRS